MRMLWPGCGEQPPGFEHDTYSSCWQQAAVLCATWLACCCSEPCVIGGLQLEDGRLMKVLSLNTLK